MSETVPNREFPESKEVFELTSAINFSISQRFF